MQHDKTERYHITELKKVLAAVKSPSDTAANGQLLLGPGCTSVSDPFFILNKHRITFQVREGLHPYLENKASFKMPAAHNLFVVSDRKIQGEKMNIHACFQEWELTRLHVQ